jgi:hypothetical protein
MKFIISKLELNGDELAHEMLEFSSSGGGTTLRFRPINPRITIATGDLFSAWIGHVDEDGEESLWPKVIDGTYRGKGLTLKPGEDTLEVQVDASNRRMNLAPREAAHREGLTLSGLLEWVFVEREGEDGEGFDAVLSNIVDNDDYEIPDPVHVDPSATWKAAADPYLAAFQPEFIPRPNEEGGTDLWILSARYPLPEDFPAEPMTASRWADLARSVDVGRPVPVVTILTYGASTEARPGEVCSVTEKLVDTDLAANVVKLGADPGRSPDGYPPTKTWSRIKTCTDPLRPDDPPRVTVIGTTQERRASDGTIISRIVTSKTFVEGSNDSVPDEEVSTRWALVNLPGGGTDFIRVERSRKKYTWLFHPPSGQYRPLSEDRTTHAEVLLGARVKLEEASRQGTVQAQTDDASDFLEVEHERTDWSYRANGLVERLHSETDLLADPPTTRTQYSDEYLGRDSLSARQRPTVSTRYENEVLLARYGPYPVPTFDGRPFGLEMAKALVDRFIFAPQLDPPEQADLEPAPFTPSFFRGQIFKVDPDDGTATFFALCVGERQRVDRASLDGETQLSLVRLPTA